MYAELGQDLNSMVVLTFCIWQIVPSEMQQLWDMSGPAVWQARNIQDPCLSCLCNMVTGSARELH
jgi:hypothetical protein